MSRAHAVAIGGESASSRERSTPGALSGVVWSHRYELSAVAVVLAAWFLRVFRLDILPPGLHHDEAIEGLNALEILSGNLRFWFPAGGGREPLFMYLTAGSIAVLGPTPFAIRILAATASTILVASAYPFVRILFDRRIALITTIIAATSYWQIHTGRLGLRSAILAPMATIAAILLLRGLKHRSTRLTAIAGVVFGLTIYTYFAARLLPVAFIPLLFFGLTRGYVGGWIRRLLAFGIASAVVASPMVAFSLVNARSANERVSEASVFTQTEPITALKESVLGVLGMFTARGDDMWKYNLDAQPIFSGFVAFAFVLGLVLLVFRVRRLSAAAIVIWIVVMALPSALATESPHFIRIAGIAPFIFVVPAVAIETLWAWAGRAWRPMDAWTPFAAVALLVSLGSISSHDYFSVWARSSQTGPAFAVDVSEAARLLRGVVIDKPVYLSNDPYEPRYLPLAFLASPVLPVGTLQWFDGRRGLVLPDRPTIVIFPDSARPPYGFLDGLRGTRVLATNEHAAILEITPPTDRVSAIATFEQSVTLLDAQIPSAVERSDGGKDVLNLNLTWRLNQGLSDDLTIFVHVENDRGGWGSRDDRFYLTSNRLAGERIIAGFQVPLDSGIPPGTYRVRLGVYRRDGVRLRLTSGEDNILLGQFRVTAPTDQSAKIQRDFAGPRNYPEFPGGSYLVDSRIETGLARPGEMVNARGYWINWRSSAQSCRIVAVVQREGIAVATSNVGFLDQWTGAQPSDALIQIRFGLLIPADTSPGPADVTLSVCDSTPVSIGSLMIEAFPRQFERPQPPITMPAPVVIGGFARLIGFSFDGDWRSDGQATVSLFWESIEASKLPMTVFVHLIDGATIVAQNDQQPVNGNRPTSGWTRGEYLIDKHVLQIPASTRARDLAIAIGFYDPVTGNRARVIGGTGADIGDTFSLPEVRTVAR